jgi:hypothetical protein
MIEVNINLRSVIAFGSPRASEIWGLALILL